MQDLAGLWVKYLPYTSLTAGPIDAWFINSRTFSTLSNEEPEAMRTFSKFLIAFSVCSLTSEGICPFASTPSAPEQKTCPLDLYAGDSSLLPLLLMSSQEICSGIVFLLAEVEGIKEQEFQLLNNCMAADLSDRKSLNFQRDIIESES